MEFAKAWPGDLARGIPAGIPEGWVLSWCNWRMGEGAPAFPRNWRKDLVDRFVADWVKKRPDARARTDSQSPIANSQADSRAARIAAIEAELKTQKNPAWRDRLRAELNALENVKS